MKDFNKALNYSFLLLKYRARSKKELTVRLKRKGYDSSLIKEVVNYLQENNYINDEDFTSSFISYSLEKGWGPKRIEFNLKKLGIPYTLRKQALEGIVYSDKIRELIEKKVDYYRRKKPVVSQGAIWQRVGRTLAAKGFEYEDISREMRNLGVDRLEDR